MGKPIDSRALAILKKLNLDQKDEQGQYKALWDCHGTWVMYHRYIEQAGAENGVSYVYDEIETNSADGIVVVKCLATMTKDKKVYQVISYGESSPKNTKNSYPYAMAEKRAYDRCVLKLLGLHGFVYSEDEMPEEKLQKGRASSKLDSNIKIVNVKELKRMINKVILVGRLGADPELKQTKNGDSFANLSLATNKKIKDNEKTTWHKVVVFDPRIADTMGKYAKKGTQLYIEGEIETRSYKDANDNQRYVTEIIVPRYAGVIKMLSSKSESKSSDSGSDFDDQF